MGDGSQIHPAREDARSAGKSAERAFFDVYRNSVNSARVSDDKEKTRKKKSFCRKGKFTQRVQSQSSGHHHSRRGNNEKELCCDRLHRGLRVWAERAARRGGRCERRRRARPSAAAGGGAARSSGNAALG